MPDEHATLLAALRDLGERLDLPAPDPAAGPGTAPSDPVAEAVARIRGSRPEAPRVGGGRPSHRPSAGATGPGRPRSARRLAPALVAAVALVVVGVVATPGPRGAVARLLGIGGARVELTDRLPAGTAGLHGLGERITVDDARDRAAGPLDPEGLGPPAAAFAGWPDGGVSLVWASEDGLPPLDPAEPDGAALIVTVFPAGSEGYHKSATRETGVEAVEVGGSPGYWLSGGPHDVDVLGPGGQPVPGAVRLAGDTLLWTDDDLTYRLESGLDRNRAVALAETIG
jgi:hypothetical protein